MLFRSSGAVVCLRGDVGDGTDFESGGLQGTDGGFTTGTRARSEERRETAIRSLQSAGLEVGSITDVTPQAHNGVDLREPLKPTSPPDAQDTTAPDGSVI